MTDSAEPTFLSQDAIDKLKLELEDLVTNARVKNIDQIRQARELGDVSDNAAYETAKQDQAMLEGRIARLEELVKTAVVREVPTDISVVSQGVRVTVRDIGDPKIEDAFVIAESEERVTGARVLSPRSPLGSALMGKRIGDQVTYEAPGGTFTYELVALEPA